MYTFFLNTKHGFFQGDLHIYSPLQKYSYAFIFSPMFCLMLNCFKYFFSTPIYSPYTIMVKQKKKKGFNIFANVLKITKVNDTTA